MLLTETGYCSRLYGICKILVGLQVLVNLSHSEFAIIAQHICYSQWANGAQNGMISIRQWDVFNPKKAPSDSPIQKEGVVTNIIFSNHKTY